MKEYIFYLCSFIGIAINIWIDTPDAGGGSPIPTNAILDRFNVPIVDRFTNYIISR